MIGFIISLVCVLFGGFYFYMKYAFTYWAKRGVEYIEPSFPFGNATDLFMARRDFGTVLKDFHAQIRGDMAGIYMFNRPTLLIKNPELLKKILIKDFDNFVDRGIYVDEKVDPVSANLFSISGQRWRTMRNKMSPAFTSGKLKMMFSTVVGTGKNLENYLQHSVENGVKEIEIRDVSARYLTDLIASVAFGIEVDSLNDPNTMFRKMGAKSVEPTFKLLMATLASFITPWLLKYISMKQIPDEVEKFMLSAVQQTLEYREKNNISREDFFQIMIQLRNGIDVGKSDVSMDTSIKSDGVKRMSLEEITAQCFVFFAAGFETSSTVMSFCIFELVKNKQLMREVQEEIDNVLKNHNGALTYDSISEMKKLEQCIDETQRMYPPAPFIIRICTKDYKIPDTNITIEEGTNIFISMLGIHHDPAIFPNPNKFDPSRFEPENKIKIAPMDYMPFGDGPRNCVGMRLGKMNTKVGLVSLLSKFDFELGDNMETEVVMDPKNILMFPKDGIRVKITKRNI